MHTQAYRYVRRMVRSLYAPPRRVCELGSFDVNGSVRDLFPGAEYVGVDSRPGPGVDIAADAADWPGNGRPFDCVVCTEVLEHTPRAEEIVRNAFRLLDPGGVLIVTAAAPGREPHDIDGGEIGGEWYANVDPGELRHLLHTQAAFALVDAGENPGDVYAIAFKRWD